ncbi:MAG: hypothetical protein HYT93_01585 [Parcubacteria group bacterium]|nr:hypothetical protein [Parcubacteria group bacterium]
MEHFLPENLKPPMEKLAAEAIAAEQLEEMLDATRAVEVPKNDFSKEQSQIKTTQEIQEKKTSQKAKKTKRGVFAPQYGIRVKRSIKEKQKQQKEASNIQRAGFVADKRIEMNVLKKRLKDIDSHIDYPEEERVRRRVVFFNEENKGIFVNVNGKKKQITFGDVVADMDWGILYRPDESCPRDVWRKIRKLSDLSEARQKIGAIFNDEIVVVEGITHGGTNIDEEFIEKHFQGTIIVGAIGEKMAKNILIRMSYNNPEILFKVESANAIEDTELKYDFKVYILQKVLGVAVEGTDMSRDEFVKNKRIVGIQFTISSIGANLIKKKHQIKEARGKIDEERFNKYVKRKVDDIVLVSVPLTTYKDCFKQWLLAGKPSGGPEQFLSEEEKNKLVNTVLSSLQK